MTTEQQRILWDQITPAIFRFIGSRRRFYASEVGHRTGEAGAATARRCLSQLQERGYIQKVIGFEDMFDVLKATKRGFQLPFVKSDEDDPHNAVTTSTTERELVK